MKDSIKTGRIANLKDFSYGDNSFNKDLGSGLMIQENKPRLLLHACCGPCSTACIERLADEYDIIAYYYNPNIMDSEEYYLRKEALIKFINAFNNERPGFTPVEFLEGKYEPAKFVCGAKGLEDEPEGGLRCDMCFEMRLSKTATVAKKIGADFFTTTMSISPHKSYKKIYELGKRLEEEMGPAFLDVDFKKKNGFARSVELSKKYGLYRQNFCGCEFARNAMKTNTKNK